MKFSLLLLAALLCLGQLNAANWYVAPTGNDNNPGTLSQPFKTIPAAILAAEPGDVIELRNGTYPSNEIRITKSNLTIRSYPGEWAVLVAPLDVEDIASCIWYNEPDVLGGKLERLEIIGGYYYGVSFETNWEWGGPPADRHGARNITLLNCRVHDTGRDCIKIKPGCSNIQIIGCELYNSGKGPSNLPVNGGPNAEGIDNVNGDGMVVRQCYIHHTSTTGVYAKGGVKDCIIEQNLVMNTGEAGILLGFYTDAEFFDNDGTNPAYYECQYSLARNNIVVNTGASGIGFFAARNCSAYNNTVVTASPDYHAPLFISRGDIYIDENTTVNPANFNIQVFNNIFVDQSGTGDEDYTVQVREAALTGTNLFDHNIYYKTTGAASFDDGVSYPALTLSQWKTQLGLDAQSSEINPALNAQFHLNAGSPAINAGQNAPATQDYDAQTRAGVLDIGADEYGNGPALVVPPPANVIGTGADGAVTAVYDLNADLQITVSPNPSSDFFTVTVPETTVQRLQLLRTDGQLLRSANSNKISVAQLTPGLYILLVRANQKEQAIPVVVNR
jgi:hypothetical protein